MKCPEIRNQIEGIEALKAEGHTIPDEVASHIKECPDCDRYYKNSQIIERDIFKKIKDIKGSVIPAGLFREKPRNAFFRNLFIAVPLACAAVVAFIVYFSEADLTEILVKQVIAGTIPFKAADTDTVSDVLTKFREKTGIEPSLPSDIEHDSIQKIAFISAGTSYVCAFTCISGRIEFIVFVFEGREASWSCCPNGSCKCLSTDSCKAERSKKGKLGYLVVTPSYSTHKKTVFIFHNYSNTESSNG